MTCAKSAPVTIVSMLSASGSPACVEGRWQQFLRSAHLWVGCLWAIGMSNSNALESIGFGLLVAVTIARWPLLWREWGEVCRQPITWAFTGLLLWRWIAVLWADGAHYEFPAEFERMTVLPWLLWPLRDRAKELVTAFVTGAMLSVLILAARNVSWSGFATYTSARTHGKETGMMGVCFAQALLLTLTLPRDWIRTGSVVRGIAAAVLTSGLVLAGQRTGLVAVAAVTPIALLLAVIQRRAEPARVLVIALFLLVAVPTGLWSSPRVVSTIEVWVGFSDAQTLDERLEEGSGYRWQLALGAIKIWKSSPIVGVGTGGFRKHWGDLCDERPQDFDMSPKQARTARVLGTSHNGFLDELASRGVIGFGILVALVGAIAVRAIRPSWCAPLACSFLLWLCYSLTDATTGRGTHQAILACIAVAAAARPWYEEK